MAERDALIKKRGTLKAKITLFKKHVHGLPNINLNKGEVKLPSWGLIELEERIEKANVCREEFESIQDQLSNLGVDQDAVLLEESEAFDNEFFSIVGLAKNIIQFNKMGNVYVNSGVEPAQAQGTGQVSLISNVKLPDMPLKRFSGSISTWLEFRDSYLSVIHENERLSDILKFQYLKASLEDNALRSIASIELSAANYSQAWSTLCDRYNNVKLLINNHIKALFSSEQITQESSDKLRNMVDLINNNLKSLNQLKIKTENWDPLLIQVFSARLDSKSAREWEISTMDKDFPTLVEFIDFLNNRADLLERIEISKRDKQREHSTKQKNQNKSFFAEQKREKRYGNQSNHGSSKRSVTCAYCKKEHYLYQCNEFQNLLLPQRWEQVKVLKLCYNCLRDGHRTDTCRFNTCRVCKRRHNTILHDYTQPNMSSTDTSMATGVNSNTTSTFSGIAATSQVLLSTARAVVYDVNGNKHNVRCILDSGSKISLATTELCNELKLKIKRVDLSVSGLNNSISKIKGKCDITMRSLYSDFKFNISCYILQNISGYLPHAKINSNIVRVPNHVQLADPEFREPGQIVILLGADIFWSLIGEGQLRAGKNEPVIQETALGWVVAGPIPHTNVNLVNCNFIRETDIQEQLENFWKIEEIPNKKPLSIEEQCCEEHFKANTRRAENGQFVVSIPFKDDVEKLGDSKQMALRQFLALEKRLNCKPEYKKLYCDFMKEYEDLGHMRKVTEKSSNSVSYFLPHHGVLRTESTSTKLRVVFNASSTSSTGVSLNDLQMVGPTIQNDLISILLNFRLPLYVVTADIEKMYRKIYVDERQHSLQKVLWRPDSKEEIGEYELQTVTYGTASAPYLAIKCLYTLGDECKIDLPEVSKIIKNNFYVDDVLFGKNDLLEIQNLCVELNSALKSGGFTLRKWKSNDTRVIELVTDHTNVEVLSLNKNDAVNKTLGLGWICTTDHLAYNTKNISFNSENTKRAILSNISKVFDPLGLLRPVIIIIKILLQRLWMEKLNCDDELPNSLSNSWLKFKEEIHELDNIQIDRRVICKNTINIQLHAFCDSSVEAYGSCVYVRSENSDGTVFVRILCTKSKVAPLKSLTIPKLELCGALVAARLMNKLMDCVDIKLDDCFIWTDSTIVLGWLKTSPNLLKPFVNNRVAEIQDLSRNVQWRHVSTNHNPADILSRGLNPSQLKNKDQWWFGPNWLIKPKVEWPDTTFTLKSLPELRTTVKSLLVNTFVDIFEVERFSNLQRLQNTAAYVCRFIENCRKPLSERQLGVLTRNEIETAFEKVLKITQAIAFQEDYNNLINNNAVEKRSKLLSLTPFIDNGLIRVGGRLRNSSFNDSKKHPILVPPKNHVTRLILAHEHLRLLHVGPQQLLASVRERFWPLLGRNLAKQTVRNCVICSRFSKANVIAPIMTDLPKVRVEPSFPFENCGTDYAGPFLLKDRKGRGSKTSKCYLCLFICLSTKAIHLELATDLTTECFILCLRRFASRRGKPKQIFSDNGTNYAGATKELNKLGEFLRVNNREISERATAEGIQWTFIPPYSPHMGGIWEAGVKAVKFHLKRVLKNAKLTFEEFYTVVTQIEAILNSRPLFPLPSDPNDLNPLTPAHFLVGRSLHAIPHPRVSNIPENRLSRYQYLERLHQHFWERWSKEYISELQQRSKWKSTQSQLTVGHVVLIKEDGVPPMSWILGKIIEIHPGSDGVARIATIKTKTGNIKRSFAKICPLPVNSEVLQVFHTFQGGRDVQNRSTVLSAATHASEIDGPMTKLSAHPTMKKTNEETV